jgi:homoserine kinase
MGPGFDCMGMALDVWNSIEVRLGPPAFAVHGQGERTLPRGESNLVYRCFSLPFEESGTPVPEVGITCRNEIPLARGLGSSSAAIVGGLVAGNEMCGRPLSGERLLELAATREGHPDNVAPAMLGGCQVAVWEDARLVTSAIPMPEDIRAVLYVPEAPMPTERARGLLASTVPRADAVYNIGRVAMLVRAFATGDLADLAVATGDRLHQPARQSIFPAMGNIFRAALGAGALAVFLSGAGSSVLALAREREVTIGYEMADAAAKSGIEGTIAITRPSPRGCHVADEV